MAEPSPAKQKYLCRGPNVRFTRWQEKEWNSIKLEVVTQGNYYKFSQDPGLKKLLMETGDRKLIEAAPNDKIWEIGFEGTDAKKHVHRKDWGLNLLEVAMMAVRARLRGEDGAAQECAASCSTATSPQPLRRQLITETSSSTPTGCSTVYWLLVRHYWFLTISRSAPCRSPRNGYRGEVATRVGRERGMLTINYSPGTKASGLLLIGKTR